MSLPHLEFPLRVVSGNVWPPLAGRMHLIWNAYLELCRSEHYRSEEIEALQLLQLRAVLSHAKRHVPYYRAALESIDPETFRRSDLTALPLLSRLSLQSHAAELRAAQLPSGTKEAGVVFTAGSSGIPVAVPQTNMVQLWWQAMSLRDLRWGGIDVRGSLAAIRYFGGGSEQQRILAQGIKMPQWNDALTDLMETGPSFALDIHQNPEKQLDWLTRVNPTYLISYPSNLAVLAAIAEARGYTLPKLRAILSISEALSLESRQLIEASFGVPVRNTYSCMEAGYLASPCPRGQGLHIHSENVLFEILDDDGNPTPPGVPGRVVITTLRNFLLPLVRYEIMDLASWAASPCGCGIGLPLIDAPWGKRHPPFHLDAGQLKNSMGLAVAMRRLPGIAQFRICQKRLDLVEVRVLPVGEFSGELESRIVQVMHDFFEKPITVHLRKLSEPELTKTGKASHLECEVVGTST